MSRSPSLLRALAVLAFVVLALLTSCSGSQRRTERQILDYAQTLCVLSHAEQVPAEIATLCAIDQILLPFIDQLLGEHQRAAMRHYGPAGRASAGPPCASAPVPASSAPATK